MGCGRRGWGGGLCLYLCCCCLFASCFKICTTSATIVGCETKVHVCCHRCHDDARPVAVLTVQQRGRCVRGSENKRVRENKRCVCVDSSVEIAVRSLAGWLATTQWTCSGDAHVM